MSRPQDWSPLAAEDPVPGDAYGVTELAGRLATTAQAIRTAADRLHKLASADGWDSDAGRAFQDTARNTADSVARAFRRYDETGSALKEYAPELEGAQKESLTALADAQAAQRSKNTADAAASTSADPQAADHVQHDSHLRAADRASGEVDAARRALEVAVRRRDDAATEAARRIHAVVGGDGLKDSWWDNLAAVLDVVANIAGAIAAAAGILSLLVGWIPVIGQALAAVLGAVALIATVVSLVCHLALLIGGKGTVGDVLLDALSLATFGIGRAFGAAAKGSRTFARSQARRSARTLLRSTTNFSGRALSSRATGLAGGRGGPSVIGARANAPQGIWPGMGKVLSSGWGGVGSSVRTEIGVLRTASNPLPYVREGVADLGAAWRGGGPQAFTAAVLGQHGLAEEILRSNGFDASIVTPQITDLGRQATWQWVIGAGGMVTGSAADWYQSGGIRELPGNVGALTTDVVGRGRELLDGR